MHDKPICIDEYWLCEVDCLQFHVFKVSNLVIFSIIPCYTIFLKNKFVVHIFFLGSRRGGYPLLELHQCRKKLKALETPNAQTIDRAKGRVYSRRGANQNSKGVTVFHPNPEMSSQSSDFGGSISTSTCYSHPHYRSTAHPMQTLVPGPCPCGFADYFSTSHSSGSKIKSNTVKEIHFGHTKNTISTHSSSEESPTISYRLQQFRNQIQHSIWT